MSEDLVKFIAGKFDEFNEARMSQLNDIRDMERAVFQDSGKKSQMSDMFELYQSFKAQLWQNLYSNTESLFDVKGEDEAARENELIQKKNLAIYLEKAKIQNALDDALDFLLLKSEAIIQVGWKVREKEARRKIEGEIKLVKNKSYDGLEIRAIDPENFVYDTQKNSFYIYRAYVTYNELCRARCFSFLDEGMKAFLKKAVNGGVKPFNKDEDKSGVQDGKIEILEYWGDIEIDGVVLRNQVVSIAARKFVVRRENNPYVINPFIVVDLLKDPLTQRGFLYLKTALRAQNVSGKILNNNLRALELISNPPYLAPKGAFSDSIMNLEPGKIVEYDAALLPEKPQPLDFTKALGGWDFIEFFKKAQESATGIFRNQVGLVDAHKRTATEVSAAVSGQNARLSMIIDILNQNLIVVLVEKCADLISNLVFGQEKVFVDKKGEIVIDDSVRSGKYRYIYCDRSAIGERKLKFKEIFDAASAIIQGFPEIKGKIDPWELFKFAMEQYDFDNLDKIEAKGVPIQPQAGQLNPGAVVGKK